METQANRNDALKVLCLEDSPQDVEIVRELLSDAGFVLDMDCAAVEKEFVSFLRSRKYDIILADFKLPGFDAFGALRWSLDICPDVPFICVSGTIGEETAVELIRQGAVDYVLKERLEKLSFVVKRALIEAKEKEGRKRAEEALRESEERYKILFSDVREAIFIADAESGILLDCNEAACSLTERSKEELIGQHQSILHPPDKLVGEFSDTFRRHVADEKGHVLNSQVVTKSGTLKDVEIKANILNFKGKKIVQGFFSDITERSQAEEQIRRDLEEKNIMLKEIHHRVKNNLNVITSLLSLQSARIITKSQALAALEESKNRIYTMALVHEKLYQEQDFSRVDLKSFIKSLSQSLSYVYKKDVQFDIHIEDISLDINNAIPCGLILNELVTNALKYAFKDNHNGIIKIYFNELKDKTYEVVVQDNGVGLPNDIDIHNEKSLGFLIVNQLIKQIDGVLKIKRGRGTKFQITFPVSAT